MSDDTAGAETPFDADAELSRRYPALGGLDDNDYATQTEAFRGVLDDLQRELDSVDGRDGSGSGRQQGGAFPRQSGHSEGAGKRHRHGR
ncbi:MAG: hypothetical protein PUF97_04245 [Bifidobacteriaceae bacterium]|nr:hypothetical protein [Bifidobacteriaceae bacterium]